MEIIKNIKSRWLIVPAAVVALAALIFGVGIVAAQVADDDHDSKASRFASKVASILGLNEDEVEDAITQAKKELRDETVQAKLDAMVEKGHLTQEQADEYKAWIDAKPEGIERFERGMFKKGKRHHRRGWGDWDHRKFDSDETDSDDDSA